ncbi:MAG: TetR/AcrR family transcriptional regulator [Myxococcales bacterium]|nr:TetR/AcrR family transcriptional regulator [Myxococcales bacterium]MDD9971230.1 TetR/AcrR family transcriptional regulator [Myxococcales bacterium]
MSTRERILAEATRQLTSVGYAAFTIAGVRDALGLSSGSMFHAFSSKPALAAGVYVAGMTDYQRAATAAIARAAGPEDALRAWIATHLAWIEDHRDLARFLFATLPDEVAAEAAGPLKAHNDMFYEALSSMFAQAEQAGLVGRLDRGVAQVICISPAHEYGRRWAQGQLETTPRKLTRVLQEASLAALAATRVPRNLRGTKTSSSSRRKERSR